MHDLTVVETIQACLHQRLIDGTVPVAVGERAEGLLIMAKRNLGITSKLRRWLHWE